MPVRCHGPKFIFIAEYVNIIYVNYDDLEDIKMKTGFSQYFKVRRILLFGLFELSEYALDLLHHTDLHHTLLFHIAFDVCCWFLGELSIGKSFGFLRISIVLLFS
jgi:hypothetical protein